MSRFFPLVASTALLALMVFFRPQGELADDVPPTVDPIRDRPGWFYSRVAADRARLVKERGGSAASEAAVAKGLKWLALHQAPDGRWSLADFSKHAREKLDSDRYFDDKSTGRGMAGAAGETAGTAFGLLPFLAAGITHKTAEKKPGGEYAQTVKRGLDYLLKKQSGDGDFGGNMYSHGLATSVLCEAYGLTSDPKLKLSAQRAINFIVAAQDPDGGGWRYRPREAGDTSVTGWQVMALKSGQMAGLNVPSVTLKRAEKFLDSVESPDKGGYGYVSTGDTPTLSAVGLLCRQYLGTPRRNPDLRKGCDKLKRNPPGLLNNLYYDYYATQVMYHMGGDYWEEWNNGDQKRKGMRDILVTSQDKDGSWDPARDGHGAVGGRIMITSLSLLTLEIYYRYRPLYQRPAPPKEKQ